MQKSSTDEDEVELTVAWYYRPGELIPAQVCLWLRRPLLSTLSLLIEAVVGLLSHKSCALPVAAYRHRHTKTSYVRAGAKHLLVAYLQCRGGHWRKEGEKKEAMAGIFLHSVADPTKGRHEW